MCWKAAAVAAGFKATYFERQRNPLRAPVMPFFKA